jgi:two-component system chemotaxis sensor kinase CheA
MAAPFNDEMMRQLQAAFAVEADEHLEYVNRHLLALEANAAKGLDRELLAEVFRRIHSLKGASRAVSLTKVETLAHRMETLVAQLQSGGIRPEPGLFDLLYRSLDLIGRILDLSRGGEAPEQDFETMRDRLENYGKTAKETIVAMPLAAESAPPVSKTEVGEGAKGADSAAAMNNSAAETVRVSIAKLDALIEEVGELQNARIGAENHEGMLEALRNDVAEWELQWRQLRSRFNRFMRIFDEAGKDFHVRDEAYGDLRQLLDFLSEQGTRLRTMTTSLDSVHAGLRTDSRRMAQVAGELENGILVARMLPVSTMLAGFPRMLRDLARECGKEAALEILGEETEVDRSVLERIKDPLIQMIRNCVDHGIEPPSAREKAGKTRQGSIRLTFAHRGGTLVIGISDDGSGVDIQALKSAAREKNLLSAEAAGAMDDREALFLMFRSGLSTKRDLTDISGRGIGMDILRTTIEKMRGLIDIRSESGKGTRFTLSLPLTVASTACLLVELEKPEAGGNSSLYAIPIVNVLRIARVGPGDTGQSEGFSTIMYDGHPIPLFRLSDALGIPGSRKGIDESIDAVIIGVAERRAAFSVDGLSGIRELVIKGFPAPWKRIRNCSGATILGNGDIVLILNALDLMDVGRRLRRLPADQAPERSRAERQANSILVADDSMTIRSLEKNILEIAGYRVGLATDGFEAWTMLQTRDFDLLVSDIMMPRMNGFELTEKIRADPRLKNLPVILVTSLDSGDDKEKGKLAGADAYIVKSAFDQEGLLDSIRRMI